jgi:hypothetical protein
MVFGGNRGPELLAILAVAKELRRTGFARPAAVEAWQGPCAGHAFLN